VSAPRVLRLVVAVILLAGLALSAPRAFAQDAGYKQDLIRSIEDARSKLLDLAEATPANKFAWRPGKGVRSTGEVFLHVAQANYLLPTLMGVKTPEGMDPMHIESGGGVTRRELFNGYEQECLPRLRRRPDRRSVLDHSRCGRASRGH